MQADRGSEFGVSWIGRSAISIAVDEACGRAYQRLREHIHAHRFFVTDKDFSIQRIRRILI
jgi:hypothetical protein